MINVLLMNNSKRIVPSVICYKKENTLFGEGCSKLFTKKYKYFF